MRPSFHDYLHQKTSGVGVRVRLKMASRALDDWTKRFEEFGSVTMSSPLLSAPNPNFAFGLNRSGADFFSAAKKDVNGAAFADLAIINKLSGGLDVQLDPTQAGAFTNNLSNAKLAEQQFQLSQGNAILSLAAQRNAADLNRKAALATATTDAQRAQAEQNYATALSSIPAVTAPQFPTAPPDATNVPAKPSGTAVDPNQILNSDDQAFLKLVTPPDVSSNNVLDDRTAMIEAAGNRSIQALFELLGQPDQAIKFDDKRVLFATVTVAVNPGWRTRKDFSAEITTQASFRYVLARPGVLDRVKSDLLDNDDKDAIDPELAQAKRYICKKHYITAPKSTPAPANTAADAKAAQLKLLNDKLTAARTTFTAQRNDAVKAITNVEGLTDLTSSPMYKPEALRDGHVAPTDLFTQTMKAAKTLEGFLSQTYPSDTVAQLGASVASIRGQFIQIVPPDNDLPGVNDLDASAVRSRQKITDSLTKIDSAIQAAVDLEDALAAIPAVDDKTTAKAPSAVPTNESPSEGGSLPGASPSMPFRFLKNYFYDDERLRFTAPLVTGVSPLMDTQVLDLKDAYRRQDQIALALSASLRSAGKAGQAQVFDRFVRQQQKQAGTRTAIPVVNTFSASGGLFGFQMGPRLQALEDPASRSGGSANVLDRQSFPALIIIGMDASNLAPVICKGYDGCYDLYEPELVIKQTCRWNPLGRKLFSFNKNDWWYPLDWHNPRLSERDRVDLQLNVIDQFHDLDRWLRDEKRWYQGQNLPDDPESQAEVNAYLGVMASLQQRRDALSYLFDGSESSQYLPLDYVAPVAADPPAPIAFPLVAQWMPDTLNIPVNSNGDPVDANGVAQTNVTVSLNVSIANLPKKSTTTATALPKGDIANPPTPIGTNGFLLKATLASPLPNAIVVEFTTTVPKGQPDGTDLVMTYRSTPLQINKVGTLANAGQLTPVISTNVFSQGDPNGAENVTISAASGMKLAPADVKDILVTRAQKALPPKCCPTPTPKPETGGTGTGTGTGGKGGTKGGGGGSGSGGGSSGGGPSIARPTPVNVNGHR